MKTILLIISVFVLGSVQAQFFNAAVLKTRPLQDFVTRNPSLAFEKPLVPRFSAELELIYMNRRLQHSGREWGVGQLYDSDGLKVFAGIRYYFGKQKNPVNKLSPKISYFWITYSRDRSQDLPAEAPFGWFVSCQYRQLFVKTHSVRKYTLNGQYINTIRILESAPGIGLRVGRQTQFMQHWTIESYLGITRNFNFNYRQEVTGSLDPSTIGQITIRDRNNVVTPDFGLRIGYHF